MSLIRGVQMTFFIYTQNEYGAFKHGELFLLPFCEKNLTSSILMKKFHSGVNIIKHIYGELVYAFLEQK